MAAILQASVNSPYSDRLKAVLNMAPHLLDVYFSIALHTVNNCMFYSHNFYACLLWDYSIFFNIENFVIRILCS